MNRRPWIENVSMQKIISGEHYLDEGKTMLIQIQDVCTEFVTPKFKDKFKVIHQFEFMDDEDPDWEANITELQGKHLANILMSAWTFSDSIVVHCHAGLCRSGAVAEVATMIGFNWAGSVKIPNLLVKQRILDELYRQNFFNN